MKLRRRDFPDRFHFDPRRSAPSCPDEFKAEVHAATIAQNRAGGKEEKKGAI
jgi:hypothetical protein